LSTDRRKRPRGATYRKSTEWQALRRDWPTFIASGAVYLASVCTIVAAIGLLDPAGAFPLERPLFWGFAVPLTVWAWALADYGPRAVAIFRILLIADVPVSFITLGYAYARGAHNLSLFLVTTIATAVLVLVGTLLYNRSLLKKYGAAR
jgi:hypothetical protein